MLDLPSNKRLGSTKNELRFVVKSQNFIIKRCSLVLFKTRNYSSQLCLIFYQTTKYNILRKAKSQTNQNSNIYVLKREQCCKIQQLKNTCQIQQKKNYDDRNQEFISSNQPFTPISLEQLQNQNGIQTILIVNGSDIKDTHSMLNEDVQILKQKSSVQFKKYVEFKFDQKIQFFAQ
ncbi:unnamed protein product [Paramecium pentaurelia]|uniref:Uncharacterized protein n=1 Tax=Paramecium pentaurelia TaxID=43138 RepID=A0A8S1TTH3_9CILI|nr:unnamed protein product [Paramecium pentaurelia]